ncbi:hypothetical protein JTB14_009968 [Gonioctena quinquepunctata]|nr:hypothetical protein JTB14_009968 [Gonioctena quinquepunctata]
MFPPIIRHRRPPLVCFGVQVTHNTEFLTTIPTILHSFANCLLKLASPMFSEIYEAIRQLWLRCMHRYSSLAATLLTSTLLFQKSTDTSPLLSFSHSRFCISFLLGSLTISRSTSLLAAAARAMSCAALDRFRLH